MKDGTPYQIQLCIEPDTQHNAEFLKCQIANAIDSMSSRSLWQRFASPIHHLSESQLDYLASLDGKDRVAWCASIRTNNEERGIGLARYVRLEDANDVAEFALTVIDEFQGQGIGYQLLRQLIETARSNSLEVLRGYVLPSNKHMLSLCRRFGASTQAEDSSFLRADIPLTRNKAD